MKQYILSIVISLCSLILVPNSILSQSTAPTVGFQSTSTMMGSGSNYASNPSLNADGTAVLRGPSRIGGPSYAPPGTGGDKPNPDIEGPIGDAVVPMLICALAFCGYIALRRKRKLADNL